MSQRKMYVAVPPSVPTPDVPGTVAENLAFYRQQISEALHPSNSPSQSLDESAQHELHLKQLLVGLAVTYWNMMSIATTEAALAILRHIRSRTSVHSILLHQ